MNETRRRPMRNSEGAPTATPIIGLEKETRAVGRAGYDIPDTVSLRFFLILRAIYENSLWRVMKARGITKSDISLTFDLSSHPLARDSRYDIALDGISSRSL